MTRYFLFAGEASGDLHGSSLMQALRAVEEDIYLCGVGGQRMRAEGLECFSKTENFQVMGFSDVLKSLPCLWKLFYEIRDLILKIRPECVILIDYPGFNLRLAKALRKKNFKGKIVQYICPTIWAHGKKRIETLTAHFDLLLTIFPFEAAYFAETSLRVKYIGNPLVETLRTHTYQSDWMTQIGLPSNENLIALFPGSRLGEIQRHVPQQLQAASQLKQRHPHLRFALSCAQESLQENLYKLLQDVPFRVNEDLHIVPPCYHYELMRDCKTALAKSGTVTLELALHHVPTVVHYELSNLNYLIAKYVLRLQLPHYCIVNILGKKNIFPEFMGRKLSPSDLGKELELLHFNSSRRRQIREACEEMQQQLGSKSTHQCAAIAIRELLKC
jgi:lipid-A-disaccharide synthase